MEINLYKYKEIVKSVRENVTLEEFYQILHTYNPTEFFNTMYSEKTPCWYITEYINANTVMYYANGWADKTPQKITIEKLYQSWSIEGINYTKFYTDKTQEEINEKWDINTCRYFDMEVGCEREYCICENQEPKPITDWLEANRNPEIDKQVEREADVLMQKQEKLEEASERIRKELIHAPVGIIPNFNDGFEQGVKWEQQQDKTKFSEEDMKLSFEAGYDLNTFEQLEIPNEEREYLSFKDWFEQIKNK